jgi:hypothetical protein
MLVADGVMETDGVTAVLTVIVSELEVACVVEVQAAVLVIIQVITSLLASVAVVKVTELVPTLLPFFCH